MYTMERVKELALELPGAGWDQPFEGDGHTTVFRHMDTGKWFGIALYAPRERVGLPGEGHAEVLNLKCDPLLIFSLTQAWPDIVPGYHMNRQHWISVRLEGDLPEDMLRTLMRMSFDLTARKKPSRRRPKAE